METGISISTYDAMAAGAALLPLGVSGSPRHFPPQPSNCSTSSSPVPFPSFPPPPSILLVPHPPHPQGYGPFDHPAVAFNAAPARTRAARRHVMNRDEVERARLRDRRYGFHSYAEPGGLVVPDAHDSAMYVTEQDRFNTDAAAEEKDARDQAFMRRVGEIERRRGFYTGMAEKIKEVEEVESKRWVEDTTKLQERGTAALRNRGGMPVNLLTHQYEADNRGEELRAADKRVLGRAAQRAQYLAEHATGTGDYNILSNTQAPPSLAVTQLAASFGVPAPYPVGVHHQTFVNASTTGKHMEVRETTRSAPRLKSFMR